MGPMPRATANGIELEYQVFGDAGVQDSPLLLIAGLGAQMLSWDDEFCRLLAAQRFRVIRFDNRDVGLSTWMDGGAGEYSLDDMAADAAALLDALGISAAHVVGASMGGFIAQLVALNHPAKVLTLTSIMSGPNGADQVRPTEDGTAVLMVPAPETREERIAVGMWAKQKLMGPDDPFDRDYEERRIVAALDRAYHPAGFMRQLQAIMAAQGRLARLAKLRVPTLVIHGDADILVPVDNGRNVADAIPGARLLEIKGMGHDLPRRVWPQVVEAIAELARYASPAC
jgi:pimeloyl-ACP methyl ester carboxylesterase